LSESRIILSPGKLFGGALAYLVTKGDLYSFRTKKESGWSRPERYFLDLFFVARHVGVSGKNRPNEGQRKRGEPVEGEKNSGPIWEGILNIVEIVLERLQLLKKICH